MAEKAYKFRLYPNRQQAELINKTFGCVTRTHTLGDTAEDLAWAGCGG